MIDPTHQILDHDFGPTSAFGVVVADPPWQFKDKLPGGGRGAEKHYSTMTLEDIEDFELPPLERDSILFLWRVASMQQEALSIANRWGFKVSSEIVWCKPVIGMGHYVRNAHETCLICTRKGSTARIKNHGVPSHFNAPRGRHSEKPEAFFDLVERLAEGPYIELFARRRRPGWTCLGNELAPDSVAL